MAKRGRPRKDIDLGVAEQWLNTGRTLQWIADHFQDVWYAVLDSQDFGVCSSYTTSVSKSSLHRPISISPAILIEMDCLMNLAKKLISWQERVIHRRTYDVTVGMVLWHMDSYEKLKPYGFFVHGCIDGGSNFMRMIDMRGDGSFLTGPSTANQRIENWWNWLWQKWGFYYKGLFQDMEKHGVLDRHNASDLFSLVTVFMPTLQARLQEVCSDWNTKPIRPQRARGITQYRPIHRFTDAVLNMQHLTVEDMRLVCVQMPNMDLDVIEGSFRARETNDASERSQHAPAVISPLDDWENSVCAEIHRDLAVGATPVKSYLLHKQVVAQLLLARGLYGSVDDEWMQFVVSAQGGAAGLHGDIRQAICSQIYTTV